MTGELTETIVVTSKNGPLLNEISSSNSINNYNFHQDGDNIRGPFNIYDPSSRNQHRDQYQQQHHQQQQQQQPLCEAFIMTGQKILKLTSEESDNNCYEHGTNNNKNFGKFSIKLKQQELKSQLQQQQQQQQQQEEEKEKEEKTAIKESQLNISTNSNGQCKNNLMIEDNIDHGVKNDNAKMMTSIETELDKIYLQQANLLRAASNQNGFSRSETLPARRIRPAPSRISTFWGSKRRKRDQAYCTSQDENPETIITFKTGFLYRKRIFESNGKPTMKGRRSWTRVHVILQDLRLKMRCGVTESDATGSQPTTTSISNTNSNSSETKHDDLEKTVDSTTKDQLKKNTKKFSNRSMVAFEFRNSFRIHHSFAKISKNYTKRQFVFQLRLADQTEILLQADSEQDMLSWVDSINFASACLSAPLLPSAISNRVDKIGSIRSSKGRQMASKPVIPTSYTKLSYWEQLINHDDRLMRLKSELDDLLAEAPSTRKASKELKSQYIDRIATLKQDIERYDVYADLMRKRSNSPEAIILSKNAKVAPSLQPSAEMIKSLPSFAPRQGTQEEKET